MPYKFRDKLQILPLLHRSAQHRLKNTQQTGLYSSKRLKQARKHFVDYGNPYHMMKTSLRALTTIQFFSDFDQESLKEIMLLNMHALSKKANY